jgi:hypothetical protein
MKATLGRIEERLKRLERGEAWPRVTNGRAHNGHTEHAYPRTASGDGERADVARGRGSNGHGGHALGENGHTGDREAGLVAAGRGR